jgi:hypothetical protein
MFHDLRFYDLEFIGLEAFQIGQLVSAELGVNQYG